MESQFSNLRFHVESESQKSKDFVNLASQKVKDMIMKSERNNLNFKKAIEDC